MKRKCKYDFLCLSVISALIVILFAALIFRSANRQEKQPAIVDRIDTVILTKTDTLIRRLPAPKPVTVIDCFVVYRDTAAALAECSKITIYDRLIIDNRRAKIRLSDTVFRNSLRGAVVSAEFFYKDTVITRTNIVREKVPVNQTKLFLGFHAGMTLPDMPFLAPVATLTTKNDNLYSIAYDPINKAGYVGLGWKIRLRKHQRDVD